MLKILMSSMESALNHVKIPQNGVDYRNKIVLAPMVRSGELPSRLLALKYGADLVWGPETVDKSMIGTTKRFNPITSTIDFTRNPSNGSRRFAPPVQKESVIYRLHPTREHGKLIFQIGTASPESAVEAAKLVAENVAGIDVNAGCPKPFSTSGGMGAALLQTPELLAAILRRLVKEVGEVYQIGISVKIRLLETPEKTGSLVKLLCATGITGLTVHCRTTPMRPRERATREQLRMIADICREEGVACLMNGDVKNRDEAQKLVQDYNVDGAMIATAAEANFSCFRSEAEGGLLPWREVAYEYLKTALEVDNKWGNSKFLLSQLIPGKFQVSKDLASCKSYEKACKALEIEDLYGQAQEVDQRLGISEEQQRHFHEAVKKVKAQNKSAKAADEHIVKLKPKGSTRNRLSERGVGTTLATAV